MPNRSASWFCGYKRSGDEGSWEKEREGEYRELDITAGSRGLGSSREPTL